MTEQLLQYIWQHQYFNRNELTLADGTSLEILDPGKFNANQGPDFLAGKIRIDSILFIGHIELHIYPTDWNRHSHSTDLNYNNVILHVVWINDPPLPFPSIATFVLHDRVPRLLLQRYTDWMHAEKSIPCSAYLPRLNELVQIKWQESLMVNRLQRKSKDIRRLLEANRMHWDETIWWMIARSFGGKINGETFEMIARSLPLTLIARHKNQLIQIESLLLGQGNLLNERFQESYPQMLSREYNFLAKKYNLQPVRNRLQFLRMRPGNFPSVRLAQLASLLHQFNGIINAIIEAEQLSDLLGQFDVTANDYWHYHYLLDQSSPYLPKKTGKTMLQYLAINTIIPVLYTYGNMMNHQPSSLKSLRWLESISPEQNTIVSEFEALPCKPKNACDTQALIELKNEYCEKRRCLDCAIGVSILRITNKY